MCGIVGFVSANRQEHVLDKMVKIQEHRGPDDSGLFIHDLYGVHLGHNRLSIQDISSHAHQPFISNCEEYVIVFNGEVYNFQTIREELEELGENFRSNSDTEVLLYAYKHWGIQAVDKFIGMFSLVIYDLKEKKLFLLRDRAGIKPLYYALNGDSFLFSSELKSFHQYPDFKKEIHKEILPFYFQFAYIPAPHTIYKNTFKLEPGHYIEYDLELKSYDIHKYWDINEFYLMKKFEKSEDEILSDIEQLLVDSCQLRMVSDVPVGVFLSGGYDSSTTTALLAKNQTEKLNTFTIGFEVKEFNEANEAKKIAIYLDTDHTEEYCTTTEMLALIETLPFYFDEPFADDSALPTMLVANLAKKKVTVALSADGGDEVFFGYSKYFAIEKMLQLQNSPLKRGSIKLLSNLLNDKVITLLNALLPKSKRQSNITEKFNKFKNMINAQTHEEMFLRASSKVNADFLDKILINGKFKAFETTAFKNFSPLKEIDVLDQLMAVDYKTFMVDDVLCKVDRASMSVSLEGREPLLDHRLAEYMARVPSALKYKNGKGKYLLREVLQKYLPKEMTDKPKAGFTVPLKSWINNELKEKAIASLESKILKDDAIFKEEELQKVVNDIKAGKVQSPMFIWMVINYVMWRKEW
jgi:asparagine synthase (glutamine-hydrolysing)